MSLDTGELKTLELGSGDPLSYVLSRTGRRRTVGIFVEPDGRVSVLAPKEAQDARIEQILKKRLKWIRRQQRTVEALPPPPLPRQWVAGETHRYLGRQYRLKLEQGPQSSVKLVGPYFFVTLPSLADRRVVQALMEAWYREHAERLLIERIKRALTSKTWLDVETPPITIRAMKQRWGSTTKAGRIMFNLELVKLPLPCIDYVVTHELVHLKIPNHSPAFWRMLSRVMPDWRRWRERLTKAEL